MDREEDTFKGGTSNAENNKQDLSKGDLLISIGSYSHNKDLFHWLKRIICCQPFKPSSSQITSYGNHRRLNEQLLQKKASHLWTEDYNISCLYGSQNLFEDQWLASPRWKLSKVLWIFFQILLENYTQKLIGKDNVGWWFTLFVRFIWEKKGSRWFVETVVLFRFVEDLIFIMGMSRSAMMSQHEIATLFHRRAASVSVNHYRWRKSLCSPVYSWQQWPLPYWQILNGFFLSMNKLEIRIFLPKFPIEFHKRRLIWNKRLRKCECLREFCQEIRRKARRPQASVNQKKAEETHLWSPVVSQQNKQRSVRREAERKQRREVVVGHEIDLLQMIQPQLNPLRFDVFSLRCALNGSLSRVEISP